MRRHSAHAYTSAIQLFLRRQAKKRLQKQGGNSSGSIAHTAQHVDGQTDTDIQLSVQCSTAAKQAGLHDCMCVQDCVQNKTKFSAWYYFRTRHCFKGECAINFVRSEILGIRTTKTVVTGKAGVAANCTSFGYLGYVFEGWDPLLRSSLCSL